MKKFLAIFLAALMICLLAGGYFVIQMITPAMELLPEVRTSLKALEQIDYQALNQTIEDLDVKALNEKIEQLDIQVLNEKIEQLDVEAINKALDELDVDELNAKIDELDIESLNAVLEGLDTEEMTETMENLNNAVDKLEEIGETLSTIGDWFKNKFNF